MADRKHTSLAIAVWLGILLLATTSEGLTFKEVIGVIPEEVINAGNVTVTSRNDGMVTIAFKGLPNYEIMKINPNDPVQQDFEIELPENPVLADEHTCLTGGPIGWTIHGVALYNPYNAEGTNAVEGDEAETFDDCQGHPDNHGSYHYHQLPDECVFPGRNLQVHGIARDGFPIYGPYKENGELVQENELDMCHGRCGSDRKYRYHMTKNFPYILGCFRGTPMSFTRGGETAPAGGTGGADGQRPPPPDGQRPPPDGQEPPSDGQQPPPDGERPTHQAGGGGSPNQCAYNIDGTGFEQCSGSTGSGQGGDGEPDGNGSVPREATIILTLTAILLVWLYRQFNG